MSGGARRGGGAGTGGSRKGEGTLGLEGARGWLQGQVVETRAPRALGALGASPAPGPERPPRAFRPCSRARIAGLAPRSVGVAPLLWAGGAPRPVTSPPSRSLPGCSRREMSWRPRPPRPCPPGRSRCSQPPPLGQVRGVPYGAGLAGGVPERTPQLRGSAARADLSSPSLSGGAGRAARPPRAGRGPAGLHPRAVKRSGGQAWEDCEAAMQYCRTLGSTSGADSINVCLLLTLIIVCRRVKLTSWPLRFGLLLGLASDTAKPLNSGKPREARQESSCSLCLVQPQPHLDKDGREVLAEGTQPV
ncbi:hypothetical protein H8959_008089 [Pygathrix nigripes]